MTASRIYTFRLIYTDIEGYYQVQVRLWPDVVCCGAARVGCDARESKGCPGALIFARNIAIAYSLVHTAMRNPETTNISLRALSVWSPSTPQIGCCYAPDWMLFDDRGL